MSLRLSPLIHNFHAAPLKIGHIASRKVGSTGAGDGGDLRVGLSNRTTGLAAASGNLSVGDCSRIIKRQVAPSEIRFDDAGDLHRNRLAALTCRPQSHAIAKLGLSDRRDKHAGRGCDAGQRNAAGSGADLITSARTLVSRRIIAKARRLADWFARNIRHLEPAKRGELLSVGAGGGNRTRTKSLGSFQATTTSRPRGSTPPERRDHAAF